MAELPHDAPHYTVIVHSSTVALGQYQLLAGQRRAPVVEVGIKESYASPLVVAYHTLMIGLHDLQDRIQSALHGDMWGIKHPDDPPRSVVSAYADYRICIVGSQMLVQQLTGRWKGGTSAHVEPLRLYIIQIGSMFGSCVYIHHTPSKLSTLLQPGVVNVNQESKPHVTTRPTAHGSRAAGRAR